MLSFDERFFSNCNWVESSRISEVKGAAPSLQFMFAPFVSAAHFDNLCLTPCLKQARIIYDDVEILR